MAKSSKRTAEDRPSKKTYLRQEDVPAFSLEEALRVPVAIYDNYGGHPTAPLKVAKAMEMQPNSGHFRTLTGAAIAYGLTDGGSKAPLISITPLALRICRPTEDGDDMAARREALIRPRVIGEFLRKYNGSPLPRQDIARNVLEELGVPRERTADVLDLILKSAETVGYLEEIKGRQYVDLAGAGRQEEGVEEPGVSHAIAPNDLGRGVEIDNADGSPGRPAPVASAAIDHERRRRVFITHGKNKAFIDPIKKLLAFGELEAVVSAERETVSKPLPDKVMDDMRSCGAAIIHVDAEMKLIDGNANEHTVVNPNVLIEIGAAMALYGRRFILLVKDGTPLPSNLQGLYEVRYTGGSLDGAATIRLLEAINDMKRQDLPG